MTQLVLKRFAQTIAAPLIASVTAVWLLAACAGVTLVAPYDEQIDKGLSAYNEDLVSFVANMAFKFGTQAGTYQQNEGFYAKQTGVLQTLILRAEAQDPGKGCLMAGKAVALLGDRIPAGIKPQAGQTAGSTAGCTVRMLQNIKLQLDALRTVHQVEKVVSLAKDGKPEVKMTGINMAEAKSILDGTSRAVRAVLAVEIMKKQGGLKDGD